MVSGREKERKKEREGPVDFTTHIVIQIPVQREATAPW